jgi:hypothetical protein
VPRRKQAERIRQQGASDQQVVDAYEAGTPTKDILRDLHISTNTLARIRREHGLSRQRGRSLVVEAAPLERYPDRQAVAAPGLQDKLERLTAGTGFKTPYIPVPNGRVDETWEIAYVVVHSEKIKAPSLEDALRRFRESNPSIEIRLVQRVDA